MSHADQLRADALRWMLAIAEEIRLPVPVRIELTHYQDIDDSWRIHLYLADEQPDDVHRWADALRLAMQPDREFTSHRRWLSVRAEGPAPALVFDGWNTITITTYCTVDEQADTITTDAVTLAVAA